MYIQQKLDFALTKGSSQCRVEHSIVSERAPFRRVCVCSSHKPIGPQPYPAIYVIANPVRGLLDRKRSEEHLQRSNDMTTANTKQNKNDKKKGITPSICQKKIEEGHSIERVWYTASRNPSDTPPPYRNYLAFAPIGIVYTSLYSQGYRFLYRHSRRRLGSPWIDPINTALKRLKLATVIPSTT